MKCNKCNHVWDDPGTTKCGSCGAPFYWFRPAASVLYEGGVPPTIELGNNGLDPFRVSAIEIESKRYTIGADATCRPGGTVNMPLLSDIQPSAGNLNVVVHAFLQNNEIRLARVDGEGRPEDGPWLQVLRWPVLDVTSLTGQTFENPPTIEVLESTGYKLEFSVTLRNAAETECRIGKIEFWFGNEKAPESHDTVLHLHSKYQAVHLAVCLKERQGQDYQVRLRLINDDSILFEKDLVLAYRTIPKLKLTTFQWEYNPQTKEDKLTRTEPQILSIRAPYDTRVRRRMRVEALGVGTYHEERIAARVNGGVAVISEDGRPTPDGEIEINGPTDFHIEVPILNPDGSYKQEMEKGMEFPQEENLQLTCPLRTDIRVPIQINRYREEDYLEKVVLDFGTSSSCVAMVRPDHFGSISYSSEKLWTVPIDIVKPTWQMPSFVAEQQGRMRFGHEASRSEYRPIKQLLFTEKDEHIKKTWESYATGIIQECLSRVQAWIISQSNMKKTRLTSLILTVPTSFTRARRQKLKELCTKATEKFGTLPVRIIDESAAALTYYRERCGADNQNATVTILCDFGGGSTDITLFNNTSEEAIFGGMKDFAGYSLTEKINELLPTRDTNTAEKLKKELGIKNEKQFRNLYPRPDLDAGQKKTERLKMNDAIRDLVETRFKNCFGDFIERAVRKQILKPGDTVLIVAAGEGSLVDGFDSYIKNAWSLAAEGMDFGQVAVKGVERKMRKRCVSVGAFLHFQRHPHYHPPRDLIPEDILIHVPQHVAERDRSLYRQFKGAWYFPLFEAMQKISGTTESKTVDLSELGIDNRNTNPEICIFTCLPGSSPDPHEVHSLRRLVEAKELKVTYDAVTGDIEPELGNWSP